MMEDQAHCIIGDDLDDERFEANLTTAASDLLHKDPLTQREAMSRPDADKWVEAQDEEIRRLEEHKTWTYAYPPKGANVIGSRFVYRVKHDAHYVISSHRARSLCCRNITITTDIFRCAYCNISRDFTVSS